MRRILAILFLIPWLASAATNHWFVDGRATGANNGTNWANAWPTLTNIVWASVAAGDTIYLSGGTDGQTYSNALTITKDGTESSPITIRVSQEAGHNGLVTISAGVSSGVTMRDWVTLSGAKDDTYAATYITNTVNVPMITNNIGMRIIGGNGINYTRTGPRGLKLYWLDITTVSDTANYYGIRIEPSGTAVTATNTEIAYCWVHDVGQDCIANKAGLVGAAWDQATIHHCLLERPADDGIEVGGPWTIHHNILRDCRHVRGHGDAIQSVGNFQRYYNNIVYDWPSGGFRTQGNATNYGPIQVYGNLFFTDDMPTSDVILGLLWFAESTAYDTAYWSDFVVANNTIAFANNGSMSTAKRLPLTNAVYLNHRYENNIFWQSTNYVGGVTWGDGTTWEYADARFDFNTIAGTITQWSYRGTTTNAVMHNLLSGYTSNVNVSPVFVNDLGFDFRLAEADVSSRGTGTNLSALSIPGLDVDLFGRSRGSAWDRGAVAYGAGVSTLPGATPDAPPPSDAETNLLVWLQFDGDFAIDDYVSDDSGNGNHAWKFGRIEDDYNWPSQIYSTNYSGGPTSGFSADFIWETNDWGLLGKSGQYAGITNTTQLESMTNATIMLWAYYAPATRVNASYTWEQEQNATLLSAATSAGISGSWDFGRFDQGAFGNTKFQVYSDNTNDTAGRYLVNFPDYVSGSGTTTNWHHYAVTWSNGVVRGFYQGTNFHSGTVSNDASVIITNLVIARNGVSKPYWIGVGCNTHGGTPPLEAEDGEDYPNHGWLNGAMDDVRIYNRVLTSSEIAAIYGSSETPSTPASTGRARVGSVRAGVMRGL